ncbi:hypothetical protein ABK040_000533 [Willaertia magna]
MGDEKSENGTCSVYVSLEKLLRDEDGKKSSSIKVKCIIDNSGLKEFKKTFKEGNGWGEDNIDQNLFVPVATKDNELVFTVVVGMKQMDLGFQLCKFSLK